MHMQVTSSSPPRALPRCAVRGATRRAYRDTVVPFDRTPPGILCPHFVELRWAFGCPYECQYCYLVGTSFGRKYFRAYPLETVLQHLRRSFAEREEPTLYNAGELSDGMPEHPNMKEIIRLFASPENRRGHRLLLLTKSGPPLNLFSWFLSGRTEARDARKVVVYSASVNAPSVAARWERGAPHPHARIDTLATASVLGLETRVRVDPIIPVQGWREEYADVLRRIADAGVTRVTLGTLRGLQRTINFARKLGYDTSWVEYLKVNTGWGKKMPDEKRREVYGFCIDALRDCGFRGDIGICKETVEMAKEFGMDLKMRCNCVW